MTLSVAFRYGKCQGECRWGGGGLGEGVGVVGGWGGL